MTKHSACNECGSSDGVWVYNDGAYCFVCETKKRMRFKRIMFEDNFIDLPSDLVLPKDCTNEFPERELVWLENYRITKDLREKYNIQYSPELKRIVLPIYNTQGELIYYQARSLNPKQKKYLNPKGQPKQQFLSEYKGSSVLVFVEDMISAIRVGEQFQGVALLGTSINDIKLNFPVEFCCIWLDNDAFIKARGLYRTMSNLYDTRFIYSRNDPKCYSDEEIKNFVFEALS
jgi:hypothetical protein